MSAAGHVKGSPKGLDSLRIVDAHQVAWLDLIGSGAETIAHLRENDRIVFMFCALDGSPSILRLRGTASVLTPTDPVWPKWAGRFPDRPGARAIVRARISRIGTSCGFGVPLYSFREERDTLPRWAQAKGPAGLPACRAEKNARSIDGVPALPE